MGTIFITSENSKISETFRLLLNLANKKTQREVINMLLYQILACTTHGKRK